MMTGPELIIKLQNMFGIDLPLTFKRVDNTRGYVVIKKEGYPALARFSVYNTCPEFSSWVDSGWKIDGMFSTGPETWNTLRDIIN
jgi:hypothetical protein